MYACINVGVKSITRQLASTGISFAQIQNFWSTFANNYKREKCFQFSFQRFSMNINSPLISAIFGIIEFSGLRSKIHGPRYIYVSPSKNSKTALRDLDSGNPVINFGEKVFEYKKVTTNHTFANFSPWEYECRKPLQDQYQSENDPQLVPGFLHRCSGSFSERFRRVSVYVGSREIRLRQSSQDAGLFFVF